MDLGVLLSLPVESIAVRAAIATVACVLLARLLLRIGIRTPWIRVAAAVMPAVAIVTVIVIAASQPRLPTLMVPVEARDGLAIRVAEGYLYFAPMVFPLLLAAWALFAAVRLARRLLVARAAYRRAFHDVSAGLVPGHVRDAALSVARRLEVPDPFVTVTPGVAGGAYVVGSRRPVVVLDADLAAQLDDDELEGVLAHELAHVKRRDNLIAGMLGAVRDAMFFAPGVGWAVRHLHRERELAADQVAVRVTGRPGALASGLLKVLDQGPRAGHACSAFAPSGGLVDRVRMLVDAPAAPTRPRRTVELVALIAIMCLAIVAALVIPSQVAGAERQREAVAIVWAALTGDTAATTQARAFDVYNRNSVDIATTVSTPAVVRYDEHSVENHQGTLRMCAIDPDACPRPVYNLGLGLHPRPVVTIDDAVVRSWQATPMTESVPSGPGLQMYWLGRVGER
ncbi:MAG: M56 family metallopeptidase [Nitriliruptoraceae bacterium]